MKLEYALELARVGELAMRDAYKTMAQPELNPDDSLREMWADMAAVEECHADVFVDIIHELDREALDSEVAVDLTPLDAMINRAEEFRESLGNARISPDELFTFALDMEIGEQNAVLLELLEQAGTKHAQKIMDDIARPGRQHIRPLLQRIERMTTDADLLKRVATIRSDL